MREQTEEERKASTISRAWWLAMSGAFGSWGEVADRVAADGIPEARVWLGDVAVRRDLDRVCADARAAGKA